MINAHRRISSGGGPFGLARAACKIASISAMAASSSDGISPMYLTIALDKSKHDTPTTMKPTTTHSNIRLALDISNKNSHPNYGTGVCDSRGTTHIGLRGQSHGIAPTGPLVAPTVIGCPGNAGRAEAATQAIRRIAVHRSAQEGTSAGVFRGRLSVFGPPSLIGSACVLSSVTAFG